MFTRHDLEDLLWEWAVETIKEVDSGYPSSYELNQRIDTGIIFVPDYFPHPKVRRLADEIFQLERDQRNSILYRYIFGLKPQEIAKIEKCHISTIYRNMGKAKANLLAVMRNFTYNFNRL